MKKHPLPFSIHKPDIPLLCICMLANFFGLILLLSATRYSANLHHTITKQAIASVLGILCYFVCTFINVEQIVSRYYPLIVILSISLLLLLIPFGNADNTGNRSWLNIPHTPFNLQPAEIVKIFFVLLLALQFSRLSQKRSVSHPFSIIQTGFHTLFFCGLIYFVSSDMGMVLMFLSIFLLIAWGANVHYLWFVSAVTTIIPIAYFAFSYIPQYIRLRFLILFDHSIDPYGKGFQQLRSLDAITSGGLTGQGFLKGIQTQSKMSSSLPARHSDFIFSVAGEEFGLLGAMLIILLLSTLVFRCLWISKKSSTVFGTYIVIGFGGMIATQTILNIGMCLFLAPVIGLTLPFLSYGGSSLISLYIAMGFVSNIHGRNQVISKD